MNVFLSAKGRQKVLEFFDPNTKLKPLVSIKSVYSLSDIMDSAVSPDHDGEGVRSDKRRAGPTSSHLINQGPSSVELSHFPENGNH